MALIFSAGAAGAAPASVHGVNMQAFGSIRIPALAGWPDAISTGYQNAPGYPGKLTTYSAVANGTECSGPIESGKTYQYCYFPNGLEIGSVGVVGTPANVTFYGCLFETGFNGVGGSQSITKYTNGNNISFSYSTFQPTGLSAPPVSYKHGVEYGVNQLEDPGSGYDAGSFSIDHSNFWGLAAATQIGASSQSQPVTISDSYIHDARANGGGIDHTDGILSSDGDGVTYLTINHNTIVSVANNEGIALQYSTTGYDHVTVTNNYVSGWHTTVDFGGNGSGNTNDIFTGNVFGTDLQPSNSALYIDYEGNDSWLSSLGNVWRNNTFYVVPGSKYTPVSDSGKYWVPQWTDQGWPSLSSTDWDQ
jgi:hypothetical protein